MRTHRVFYFIYLFIYYFFLRSEKEKDIINAPDKKE